MQKVYILTWGYLFSWKDTIFMDIFVGFDVAKAKLDYSIINARGIELEHGVIKNELSAITKFLKTMVLRYPGCNVTSVVEASGGYQDALTRTSYSLRIDCLVFNPLITKQQIKTTVRGKKQIEQMPLLLPEWAGAVAVDCTYQMFTRM